MNLEALSRCTAQAVNMSPIGGASELTRAEVAGALKGASLGALWLVQWKHWGMDGLPREKMERLAQRLAFVVSIEQAWRKVDYETLDRLAIAALHGAVNKPICPSCNQAPALIGSCETCHGTGHIRARGVLSRNGAYNRTWTRRYRVLDSRIQSWIGGLEREIRVKLWDE